MCGRYALATDGPALRETFEAQNAFDFAPRYNIAPTKW